MALQQGETDKPWIVDITTGCHIIIVAGGLDQEVHRGMMSNIFLTPHCCRCDEMVVGSDLFSWHGNRLG